MPNTLDNRGRRIKTVILDHTIKFDYIYYEDYLITFKSPIVFLCKIEATKSLSGSYISAHRYIALECCDILDCYNGELVDSFTDLGTERSEYSPRGVASSYIRFYLLDSQGYRRDNKFSKESSMIAKYLRDRVKDITLSSKLDLKFKRYQDDLIYFSLGD